MKLLGCMRAQLRHEVREDGGTGETLAGVHTGRSRVQLLALHSLVFSIAPVRGIGPQQSAPLQVPKKLGVAARGSLAAAPCACCSIPPIGSVVSMRRAALLTCGLLLLAAAAQGAGLPPFLGAGGSLTAHPKGCAAGTVWYRSGFRGLRRCCRRRCGKPCASPTCKSWNADSLCSLHPLQR